MAGLPTKATLILIWASGRHMPLLSTQITHNMLPPIADATMIPINRDGPRRGFPQNNGYQPGISVHLLTRQICLLPDLIYLTKINRTMLNLNVAFLKGIVENMDQSGSRVTTQDFTPYSKKRYAFHRLCPAKGFIRAKCNPKNLITNLHSQDGVNIPQLDNNLLHYIFLQLAGQLSAGQNIKSIQQPHNSNRTARARKTKEEKSELRPKAKWTQTTLPARKKPKSLTEYYFTT